MRSIIYKVYAYLFCRPVFSKFNGLLYQLSIRGLGMLNYQNDYLTGEKYWLKNYLSNIHSPLVIDIGANVGNYSKAVLRANSTSSIFAFEPHPKTYEKLQNTFDNQAVKVFNLGAGNEECTLQLYDYDNNDGSTHASLYEAVIEDLHQGTAISHNVSVVRLDDFLADHKVENIDLLKIDTEGNEYNVLLGCQNYIKANKIKAIHFEFNEMNIVSKVSFKEFWDMLPHYHFYRVLAGGALLKLEKYHSPQCEIYAFQNIVAILK